jgi:CotH kinase protein/Lamin Tail Domain
MLTAAVPSAPAQFIISEFMANNLSSVDVDEDAQHEDWIEIQNTGSVAAVLNGWYLTDNAGELRKWQFPVTTPVVSVAAGARITVWASNKNRKVAANRLHTNFKLSSGGEFLALVRPDGVAVEYSYAPAYPPQFPNGTYGRVNTTATTVVLPEVSPGKAKAPLSEADFTANFSGWNSAYGFDDSDWQTGTAGFGFGVPFLEQIGAGGDLTAMMNATTPTCFIRQKFNFVPGGPVTAVRLRVKYDDAYVCYLNGTLINSTGAPAVLTWDAAAVSDRLDLLGPTASIVVPANGPAALVSGDNLVAFHLMNKAATELTGTPPADTTNVLLKAQMEVDVVTGSSIGYLTTATRGNANAAIKTAVGPAISGTTDKPAQPTGGAASEPLVISTRVGPTLRPLAAVDPVTLRWRRMFLAETSVTMVDDGTNGDVLFGDGIYTASVPTTSLLPGEMIRWRIVARDNSASPIYSYDPPYTGFSATAPPGTLPPVSPTIEAEQYFGTMAVPVMVGNTTQPVLHWFFTGADNTVNATGTRCSFFWQPLPLENPPAGYTPPKPRFYDNVMVDLHGQSSAGFPKKSHDLSFSKDNRFFWKDGTPETSGVNLLSNYADKSKARNTTAWWVWEKSGHLASHYDTVVRVQQNNAFKGLYDLVENANSAWLEREGLDPSGTLYKMYNILDSTSGAEKKNPDDTNVTDLNNFINGIAPGQTLTTRLRYLYDNANVPALINGLATHSLILNRDFGHKNYYLFRDTNGTQEWSFLPWDQDLSLGHTWTSGQNYFDDDIHSRAALQIGVTNRLIELVYSTPELNQMFVRRLRTLADQFLVSSTETNGPIARHINEVLQQIDPNPDNPATGTDDADLETRAWGFWVDGGGGSTIPFTDSRMSWNTVRAQGARLTTTNAVPPNAGGTFDDGSSTMFPFLTGRRDFFFNAVPPTSPGLNGNTNATYPFPASQPAGPSVILEQVNAVPLTGIYQNQEYFVIRNPNNFAVDLSGWKIGGDISMTFQGGTVIPALGARTTQTTNAAYVNQLVVANKPAGFRARTVTPKGIEYRLVTGPYDHQLTGRGGVITLSRPNDLMDAAAGQTLMTSLTYPAMPTPYQNYLRITELNFRPAPPTFEEELALPGVVAGDFEYVEFINAGPAVLDLGKAYFEEGIEFTFPSPFLLNPGQRCLVVASLNAFQARYGTSHLIAGEFSAALNNGGETLRLMDPYGEPVVEVFYDAAWYPVPPGQNRTLTIREPMPGYADFGKPLSWQLSGALNGSPGAGDAVPAVVYEGWCHDFFTAAQFPTLLNPNLPAAALQDPDGDGWTNFQEYAFGSNPTAAPSQLVTSGGTIQVGADRFLTLTFNRSKYAVDVVYAVECSTRMTDGTWQATAVPVGDPVPLSGGYEQVTYRDTVPLGGQIKRFMRAAARR